MALIGFCIVIYIPLTVLYLIAAYVLLAKQSFLFTILLELLLLPLHAEFLRKLQSTLSQNVLLPSETWLFHLFGLLPHLFIRKQYLIFYLQQNSNARLFHHYSEGFSPLSVSSFLTAFLRRSLRYFPSGAVITK